MKILITGTHFTPAQAVVQELRKLDNVEIVYVGRKYTLEGDKAVSPESQIMPALGVKFIPIVTGRLRRYLSLGTMISLLKLPAGFIQGFWIVLTEKPDVIVSFGGYVAVPVVVSGWMLSIPILVHEQTLVTGLANTISSFFAAKIAVSIDREYDFPKNKTVITGNPIRKEILGAKPDSKKKIPTILITGGNQGSHFINGLILQILDKLTEKYLVIHQTGDSKFNDYGKLVDQKNQLKNPDNYRIEKFINGDQMGKIMKQADLVVSRAGANTLLELAYLGTPTLIIPIPYLYKNEQLVNAKFFTKAGLGEYLVQDGLSAQKLLSQINEMINKRAYYKRQASQAKSVVILDAAKKITQQILLLAKND